MTALLFVQDLGLPIVSSTSMWGQTVVRGHAEKGTRVNLKDLLLAWSRIGSGWNERGS